MPGDKSLIPVGATGGYGEISTNTQTTRPDELSADFEIEVLFVPSDRATPGPATTTNALVGATPCANAGDGDTSLLSPCQSCFCGSSCWRQKNRDVAQQSDIGGVV
jgi:hypothetical protein